MGRKERRDPPEIIFEKFLVLGRVYEAPPAAYEQMTNKYMYKRVTSYTFVSATAAASPVAFPPAGLEYRTGGLVLRRGVNRGRIDYRPRIASGSRAEHDAIIPRCLHSRRFRV